MTSPQPGMYFCEAYNKFGNADAVCRVNVREPVVALLQPDDVTISPKPKLSSPPDIMKTEPAATAASSISMSAESKLPNPPSSLLPLQQLQQQSPSLSGNSNHNQILPKKKKNSLAPSSSSSSLSFPVLPVSPQPQPKQLPSVANPRFPEGSPSSLRAVAACIPSSQKEVDVFPPVIEVPEKVSDFEFVENCDGTTLDPPVRLTAIVKGFPAPRVSWWFCEKEVKSSDKYKITSEGDKHICQITGIQMPDAGVYTIMALNPAGKALATIFLRVRPGSDKKAPKGKRATKIPTKPAKPKQRRRPEAAELVQPPSPTAAPPSPPVRDSVAENVVVPEIKRTEDVVQPVA